MDAAMWIYVIWILFADNSYVAEVNTKYMFTSEQQCISSATVDMDKLQKAADKDQSRGKRHAMILCAQVKQ
jgi:hypothetical protein